MKFHYTIGRHSLAALLVGAAVFVLPSMVQAASVTGLSATGVAGIGVADANYTLTSPSGLTAIGIVKHPAWVAAPTGSNWIGISNGGVTDPAGVYVYETTFDLTGLDPLSAVISGSWATDNTGEIYLNGASTGILNTAQFGSLTSFQVNSGFVVGVNSLEFRVTNALQATGNPTGLLVARLGGTANVVTTVVPLPAAAWMGLVLLGGVGAVGKIRRGRLC